MPKPSHDVIHYLRSLLHHPSDAGSSDAELLRRFVELRDNDAFAALLRRHGPMVHNLARRITGDKQLAEDVFQATFLLLAQKGGAIRRPEALPCWLHGVARRLALRLRSSQMRLQRQEARCCFSSPPNPLDELTAQEFLTVLDEELAKLPENHRAPLILCCLQGLSQEEAAKRLGCSSGAVRGRLERGRERLRLRLEKRGLTLPAALGGTLLIAGSASPIPTALAQTTFRAATSGSGVAPAVAALLEEAMRGMFIYKLKAIGAAVMLLAVTGTGASLLALRPQNATDKAPSAVSAADKALSAKKRVDLYGAPLPDGAAMRLGTLRRRAVGASLAVSADGKSIVGVRGGKYVSIWDADSGELRQKHELPGESLSPSVLSPDGRLLARTVYSPDRLEIWDVCIGRKVRELTIEGNGPFWPRRFTQERNRGSLQVISIYESGPFWPFAFSADGKRLAAVGRRQVGGDESRQSDHLIRAWDAASGKQIFRKDVRNNASSDVIAFSPDGKRLLASFTSYVEGLYCWDIATKRQLWQNKKFAFPTSSMVFAPEDKILSGSAGRQAIDLATGKAEKIEKVPAIEWDNRLALTPDGRTLLISTAKGVIVWDLEHGKELRTLHGAGEELFVMPGGKAVITNNGALQRWDLATGKTVWSDTSERGHVGEVDAVKFSADGKRLVSASSDGTVRLWDATTGRPLRVWHGHEGKRPVPRFGDLPDAGVNSLDISADGRRGVSAGGEEHIKLWDIASDKEIRTIPLPRAEKGEEERRVNPVRISPDGSRVFGFFFARRVSYEGGQPRPKFTDKLAVWDAETGSLLEMHAVEEGGGILSPDGHTLLRRNSLIDARSAKKIAELDHGFDPLGAFSQDCALIIGQEEKRRQNGTEMVGPGGLRVWEAATGKIVARLKTRSELAQAGFHPDNRYIVSNDLDGIRLRDVRDGKDIAHFHMPESIRAGTTRNPYTGASRGSYASCLAFTRDGKRMATGMPDGTILLWDVKLPPTPAKSLAAKEIESLWTDLADTDAAKAWRAVWRMADAPQAALAFLRGRVKPYPTAVAGLTRKLLADLDSDSFEVREAAGKRLKELGLQAEPALRAALAAKPSLELRRRIEPLLAALAETPQLLGPEKLRQLRALIVLERIGSPEARCVLEAVAKGPISARRTRQAAATLACLR